MSESSPIIRDDVKMLRLWIFVFVLLHCCLAAQTVELGTPNSTSPIRISHSVLILKVGTEWDVIITTTDSFVPAFENVTSATLVFHFDNEGIIQVNPAQVPLVVDGSPVLRNNSVIKVTAIKAGHVIVTSELESVPLNHSLPSFNETLTDVFLLVTTYKSWLLLRVGDTVGWIYFLAWSISFYPQIYQNWRRKSVRGLSLDFVLLNVTGFFVYGIFNIGLFWIPEIQSEYATKYPNVGNPVQINDVVFSLHAIMASATILIQCIIYEKGTQTVSTLGRLLLLFIYTFLFVILVVAVSNHAVTWLVFLAVCSYIKLFITLVKYVPQACLNWKRKSTSGWSIGNVLLDLTGGAFSILQMLIIGYNLNDWWSLLTDITKFGLGIFSICFDILFIVQHYFLYRNHEAYEPIEGNNTSVDPYEDMVTSNHIQQCENEMVNSTSSTEE